MNPIKIVSKPEYLLRPSQVFQRFARIGKAVPLTPLVRLPWGAIVQVSTSENVGSDIYHYGVFDKVVPETIWRLLDPGETGFDVGANIGQNSSVMACRVGEEGIVHAFEPHPRTFSELKANQARWPAADYGQVRLHNFGLGSRSTTAFIYTDAPFLSGATLHESSAVDKEQIRVRVEPLDWHIEEKIDVCKIDVEGNELAVLEGAEKTLARRAIRDIVFEDFNTKPNPVTRLLERHGFTLFELHDTWLKPRLVPLSASPESIHPGLITNYLATLDAPRAVARFTKVGWRCLLRL